MSAFKGGHDLGVGSPVQYRIANDSGLTYPALVARVYPEAFGDGDHGYDVVFFVADGEQVAAISAARTRLGTGPGTIGLVSLG
jgi:hypothetical protein